MQKRIINSLAGFSLALTPAVAHAQIDIVFAVDLTGSMGSVISQVQAEIEDCVAQLRANPLLPDLEFGLVTYMDYPGSFDSSPDCAYSAVYGLASAGDYAYQVDVAVGALSDANFVLAVQALSLGSGGDGPQDYARILWESGQPDSGIGYRAGATKVLVNFGDNIPHDCDLSEGLPPGCPTSGATGIDPGRDEILFTADDIDFQDDALAAMISGGVILCHVTPSSSDLCAWDHWSALTGGSAILLTGGAVCDLLEEKLETVIIPIPTVSEWGLIILALLLLTAGTIVIRRERARRPAVT